MAKVLLVRPEESRSRYDFQGVIENECLDLEWISAILKKHFHEVTVFDKQVESLSFKQFILNKQFDVFYGECRCFQEPFILEYAETFKEEFNGLVILGGIHAQACPDRLFKDYVDIVLSGYNYNDLPDIIKGKRDVFNLSYRTKEGWISNKKKAVDINDLPRPDRDYFYEHNDRYQYLDLEHAMWIRSSFSCPYCCSFCIRNTMNNKTYSRRNVYDLVDEIAENDNRNVYLVDDDFLFDEAYLEAFINEIRKRNISRRYICYGRADFIAGHEELMKQFAKIGLYYVLVGFEDIRNSRLEDYNKHNTVENNEKCIGICKRYGIRLMAMFILGLNFTGKDFRQLYSYIKKHDLKHVAVSIYTPELGISDGAEYITDDLTHFDYLHLVCRPEKLSVRSWYFHYYVLLIKLFLKAQKDGVYDFIDYGDYIRSFIRSIFSREQQDE